MKLDGTPPTGPNLTSPAAHFGWQITGTPPGWNLAAPSQGNSGSRVATVVVASQDSTAAGKAGADYVCDGIDDHIEILAAVAALPPAGGRVCLLEGYYACPEVIGADRHSVFITGQGGLSTIIGAPQGVALDRAAAIIFGVTQQVGYCGLEDLWLNVNDYTAHPGGSEAVRPGSGHGVVITGGETVIRNVDASYQSGDPFHYGLDLLQPELTTTVSGASDGLTLRLNPWPGYDTIEVASTAGFRDSGVLMIRQPDGRVAHVPYASKTATTFVDAHANWRGDDGFTLATGDEIYQTDFVYECTTICARAEEFGGTGFYIDWNFSSCEWILARCQGVKAAKPSEVGEKIGFYAQGSLNKFLLCHPYWMDGWGMQMGDKWTATTGGNRIIGGEYESCARGGFIVINNYCSIYVTDAQFYDNGVPQYGGQGWFGTDIEISYGARDVNIMANAFFDGPLENRQGTNIRILGAEWNVIEGNDFHPTSWPDTVVECVYIQGDDTLPAHHNIVRGNKMRTNNAGAKSVTLAGTAHHNIIESNVGDAAFHEVTVGGHTPDYNTFRNNELPETLGSNPYYHLLGANSRVYGEVPPPATTTSPGWHGQHAYDNNYEYRCVATDTWKRTLIETWEA